MQAVGHPLAELRTDHKAAPRDDPWAPELMGALDRINGPGRRMPGLVWTIEGSGEPATGNTGNAITANLTVCENPGPLQTFVGNAVPLLVYDRRPAWLEVLDKILLAFWSVPAAPRPTPRAGMKRPTHNQENDDSDYAFGGSFLNEARACKRHTGAPLAVS